MTMVDFELKAYSGEDEISYSKRKAYFYRFLKPSMNYGNKAVEKKLISSVPLTPSEKEEINAFWGQYMPLSAQEQLLDFRYYGVFKSALLDGKKLCNYIPDTFHYLFIDDYYTNPQHSYPCDDKNLYDLYFYDVNRPKTLFRKIENYYIDDNYNDISVVEAVDRIKDHGEVVLKIAKFSSGGKGVLFWNPDKDEEDVLMSFLRNSNHLICQEVVKQHPLMNELNPSSVNTIRLVTFVFNNQVYVLSSAVRFGIKGLRTDNINSGGLACGIEPSGRLKRIGFDVCARQFKCHPNGKSFDEYLIPNYCEAIEMVVALAKRLLSISKLISWDIAIDEKEMPLLIEANLSGGGLSFHQICNGPFFGDMTEDVLKDVFKNSYTLKSILKSMQ